MGHAPSPSNRVTEEGTTVDRAPDGGHSVARPADAGLFARLHSAFDWTFGNRETGGITVVQMPNLPLWIFLATTAIRLIASPDGAVGAAVQVVATATLGWWAIDEVVRGVNPWRRALGVLVFAVALVALIGK